MHPFALTCLNPRLFSCLSYDAHDASFVLFYFSSNTVEFPFLPHRSLLLNQDNSPHCWVKNKSECVECHELNNILIPQTEFDTYVESRGLLFGGPAGNRTPDLLIANEAFYH